MDIFVDNNSTDRRSTTHASTLQIPYKYQKKSFPSVYFKVNNKRTLLMMQPRMRFYFLVSKLFNRTNLFGSGVNKILCDQAKFNISSPSGINIVGHQLEMSKGQGVADKFLLFKNLIWRKYESFRIYETGNYKCDSYLLFQQRKEFASVRFVFFFLISLQKNPCTQGL